VKLQWNCSFAPLLDAYFQYRFYNIDEENPITVNEDTCCYDVERLKNDIAAAKAGDEQTDADDVAEGAGGKQTDADDAAEGAGDEQNGTEEAKASANFTSPMSSPLNEEVLADVQHELMETDATSTPTSRLVRPRGRAPAGKVWDENAGWVSATDAEQTDDLTSSMSGL